MQTESNHGRKESDLLPLFVKEIGMIVEPNTKTDFFYVDGGYIEYLKSVEVSNRGFTCVPNVHYWNTNKFVFGAVLLINEISNICCVSDSRAFCFS